MKQLSRIVLFAAALVAFPATAQDQVPREITRVAGDLYRFQNRFHVSVFYANSDGILVTDPIDADAAHWLLGELDERFPGVPIRYLVYSHDHRDHIAGGEVFKQAGATVIAHENAKAAIVGEARPTAVPDVTFAERMSIEIGGKVVELIYPGPSHSDNLIIMHFPAERAVFTVDFISVNRVGFKDLADAYFPQWLDAIEVVEAMDFDHLIPGHGPVGTKADATAHREYLQAVYDGVLAGARAGQSLDAIKSSLDLSAFRGFGMFKEWGPLNVEGMYRQIQLHRRGN